MFVVSNPPESKIRLKSEWGKHKIDLLTYAVTWPGIVALDRTILGEYGGRLKLNRVVTHHATPGAYRELKKRGVKLMRCENLHAKAILVPGRQVGAIGSFNITHKAFNANFETFMEVSGKSYCGLEAAFNEVLKHSQPFTEEDLAHVPPEFFEDDYAAIREPADTPHTFQQTLIDELKKRLARKPHKFGICLKLPTGAGKTLVAAEVVKEFVDRFPERRVLWLCHRREVLRQAEARVAAQLGDARAKNVDFSTPGMARYELPARKGELSLIVVDEAHRYHRGSKGYSVVEEFRRGAVPLLGMTATPPVSEKHHWGSIWKRNDLVGSNIAPQWLLKNGYLAELDPAEQIDTGFAFVFNHGESKTPEKSLLSRVGEFNNHSVNKAARKAWADYKARGYRCGLMFAVTKEHCDTLVDKYFRGDRGVRKIYSGMSPSEIRDSLDWFKEKANESRLLVSVLMLTEGVDVPKVDSLFLVRPTFSRTLHDQMLGRGLRGPKAGGTDKCAVVDFTYSFEVEVKGGRAKLSGEQVTTSGGQSTDTLEASVEADDEGEREGGSFLPMPGTLGEARKQQVGCPLEHYCNHVTSTLYDEQGTDFDMGQVRAALKSSLPGDVNFELALSLFTKSGKLRLPAIKAPPKTGTALKRWLNKADEKGVSADSLARILNVTPSTLQRYQSKPALPPTFVARWRLLMSDRAARRSRFIGDGRDFVIPEEGSGRIAKR